MGGVYFVLTISHKEVVDYVFKSVGKAFRPDFVEKFFPVRTFVIGRTIAAGLLLVVSAIIFYYQRPLRVHLNHFFSYCKKGFFSLRNCLQSDLASLGGWGYLLAIIPACIFLFQLYLAASWPFQYDEAWSYNYHIGNNFFASFLLPNNHIFYTIIAHFFNKLPFPHEVSVRLPLIFASFISFVFLYYFLRQHINMRAAWLGALFFYSSCPVTFYSFYARGYLFVLLFALLFLNASYKWLLSACLNNQALLLLVIAFILSVYSVPTGIYFFIPSFILLLWECYRINKSKVKLLLSGIGIALLILVVLNAPSLLSGHGASLARVAQGSRSMDGAFIKTYLHANEYFNLGTEHFGGALYVLTVIVIMILLRVARNKEYYPLWICLLGLVIPFIFLYVQRVLLVERFMVHFSIYFAIVFAFTIQQLVNRFPFKRLRLLRRWSLVFVFSALMATLNLHAALNHYFFNWSLEPDRSIKKIAAIMKDNGIDSLYLFAEYAKPGIQYYFKIDKKPLSLMMPHAGSLDYSRYDSTQLYQSVIWETARPVSIPTDRYRIIFKDESFTLAIPGFSNGINR